MITKFQVTRVEISNPTTGESFSVPGMRVTVSELRAMVSCASGVFCDVCGESVDQCPVLRKVL